MKRRVLLGGALGSGVLAIVISRGLLMAQEVLASWPKEAFDARSLQDAMTGLLGSANTTASEYIRIEATTNAVNGASVPVTVFTDGLDKVESVNIFVEKNPAPLLANFEMSDTVANYLTMRIKLAETSDVIAVVKTGSRLYSAKKKIKVSIGGCGA